MARQNSPTAPNISSIWVEVANVSPSPTNPRSRFNEEQLAELADSVGRHGVLQPIVIRPLGDDVYEVVCGHRRLEAAKRAGLAEIPAVVQELTDVEVLEIQLVENLQRADIHPLDEAEGYWQLHRTHGYTVEDLAIKVGKSKAYVYARLKLRELPEAARKLWHQDLLTPSTALLVARIPDQKLAAEAAAFIAGKKGRQDQPMSFRDAARFVQDNYMLRLKDAPFPVADADLVTKAGACADCPKRTGNQSELFGDVKSADVCTDPVCFRAKAGAWGERRLEQASEKGLEVLPKGETKGLFRQSWRGFDLRYDSPYVETTEKEYHGGKHATLKRHLGKHAPPPILAVNPETGQVHELWRKDDVKKALVAAGKATPSGRAKASPQEKAAETKRKLEAKIEAETGRELMAAVLKNVETRPVLSRELLRGLALCAAGRAWHDTLKEIQKRRGLVDEKKRAGGSAGYRQDGPLIKAIHEATPGEVDGWLVEILLAPFVDEPSAYSKDTAGYKGAQAILDALEIDRKAIEKQVTAEVRAGAAKKPSRTTKRSRKT